ncbi:MAG TPA: 30S ribosomal protein S6 [Polyangiaceae bacterium]|nr:30S ribosomal protein S6 [Polyangiaceae bacterium]
MAVTLTSTAPNRVREYETIYILRGDVDPDGAERVSSRVNDVVSREQGKLVKVESWGRRKLAFEVSKQRRGVYMYLRYLGGGAVVNELERNLRMFDTVIRYQTVLVRDDIVADEVAIDPEEVKFTRLEPAAAEDEREESRERLLGLVDAPEDRRPPRRDGHEGEEAVEEVEEPNLNPDIAEAAAPEEEEK